MQWPCPPEDSPVGSSDRNPIRYINDGVSQELFVDADGRRPRLAFATPSRRAVFHPRPHMDAAELPDDEFPMVLNTGRLQHQWHTMTKTGKVAKLNKLNPGPFVEIHPEDAATLGISDGRQVELVSRRGRAVLPAVVTDRVRPGNTWVPFHWNDEHGEHLTVNALTNDAVDPDSLQPEFKVCAVRLTPVPVESVVPVPAGAPELTDEEKYYLAGFLAGIADGLPGVPVLPAAAPVGASARLWVDGLLAGRYSRLDTVTPDPGVAAGPLVLWASQTGNAEEFAGKLGERLSGARLRAMDDVDLADLSEAGEVVIVTSTFGDGGPPDNGADFWERLESPEAPSLEGLRYTVLGIGDRSYDNFCGHAKSLDTRFADLGATRMLDRAEHEAYDDQPLAQWADSVIGLMAPEAGAGVGAETAPSPPRDCSRARIPLRPRCAATPADAGGIEQGGAAVRLRHQRARRGVFGR